MAADWSHLRSLTCFFREPDLAEGQDSSMSPELSLSATSASSSAGRSDGVAAEGNGDAALDPRNVLPKVRQLACMLP
jgi:hypothetical protein